MNIGTNIKRARLNAGMTQRELSQRLGVSQAAIVQFEAEKANPRIDTLKRIAEALNCSVDDLLSDNPAERITTWELGKTTADAFDGLLVVLIDLYGSLRTIQDEETGDFSYILDENDNEIYLTKDDLQYLYTSIKGFVKPSVEKINELKTEIRKLKEKEDH